MAFSCNGCSHTFGDQRAFVQHLRKTRQPGCIQVRQEMEEMMRRRPVRADLPSKRKARQEQDLSVSDSESESDESNIFNGDYFGTDYHEEDFPFPPEIDGNGSEDDEGVNEPILDLSGVGQGVPIDELDEEPEHDQHDPVPAKESDTEMEVDNEQDYPPEDQNQPPDDSRSENDQPNPPQNVYIEHFGGRAGEIIHDPESDSRSQAGYNDYGTRLASHTNNEANPWAPFKSQIDWEVARWAKLRGPGSTAFSELLAIPGTHEKLGLSYKTTAELNRIVDSLPGARPAFVHHEVEVAGEQFDLFARDIVECIQALFGDPEHAQYLCFVPERHYADAEKKERIYHDMYTGKWWWSTQVELEKQTPGATIIPVILSSDKTQLTLFRNKTAYPVYLTIGNLPKSIRRKPSRQGQILLAYLPTTRLTHISNKSARRRTLANLFHACLEHVVAPLHEAGVNGVDITSGDGVRRRGHPILASYIGDYPEQCMVTGAYTGDCPICDCPHDELGDHPYDAPLRDLDVILDALEQLGLPSYSAACRNVRIKPLQRPFWTSLPYVNIFQSITPDILHQLYQGVVKHLVSWLTTICGAIEIDARVRRFPPNHSIRIFQKGITNLTRVSGTEHKQIAALLLGLISNIIHLPHGISPIPLITATRAILDFLYLAQYTIHNSTTLQKLQSALDDFHDNAFVFIDLGVRNHFNIPKLHSLQHYVRSIKLFGTADNFNTEATERLHIDFAKDAYKATNHKNEFLQMTTWLERKEKIIRHSNFMTWQSQHATRTPSQVSARRELHWRPPSMARPLQLRMTIHPSRNSVSLDDIVSPLHYNARSFLPALTRFVALFNNPTISQRRQLDEHARSVHLPFTSLPVFHRIKFWNEELHGNDTIDSIHVQPPAYNNAGVVISPARFDTALINVRNVTSEPQSKRLQDFRVGRVKLVFAIPPRTTDLLFRRERQPPKHLAYVEWFTRFTPSPEPATKLYRVHKALRNGECLASVVPIELISRSVHLLPKWGGNVPLDWTSENVIDTCPSFLVNAFKDMSTYFNVY